MRSDVERSSPPTLPSGRVGHPHWPFTRVTLLDAVAVDLDAEEDVGFLAQVFAVVKIGLAMQLIGGAVEIAIGDGKRVGPLNAGIVGDEFVTAVEAAAADAVVLVVAVVEAAFLIGLHAI